MRAQQRLAVSDTFPKPIRCRAAVAWESQKPFVIEEVEVAPPKEGEVRIRVLYASLCHTDTLSWNNVDVELGNAVFPAVLGHEGAGIVESVGPDVTQLKPGDHVVPCCLPQCGACPQCKSPKSNFCTVTVATHQRGLLPDGTSRFTCKGQVLHHFMGCSTLSEYTVCAVIQVAKVSDRARLDRACLLACGVSTGYGAALKVARVQPDSRCAVWGVGAVGLSAVVGCKRAGASQIVAIDLNPKKLELAKRFGATHTINPKDVSKFGSLRRYIMKNFDGGFDFTFECIGNVHTTREALECCTAGGGTACVVGIPPKGEKFSVNPMFFINGRTLVGTLLGGWKCRDDIPRLVEEAEAGKLDLDAFITHRMPLDDINKALELHYAGNCLKTVILMSEDNGPPRGEARNAKL